MGVVSLLIYLISLSPDGLITAGQQAHLSSQQNGMLRGPLLVNRNC